MEYIIYIILGLISLFFFIWIKYTRFYEKKIRKGEKDITIDILELRECLQNYYNLLEKDNGLKKDVKIFDKLRGKGTIHINLKEAYENDPTTVFDYIKITKDKILINGETQLNEMSYCVLKGKIKIKEINFTYNEYLILVKRMMKIHYFFYKIFNKND